MARTFVISLDDAQDAQLARLGVNTPEQISDFMLKGVGTLIDVKHLTRGEWRLALIRTRMGRVRDYREIELDI